MKVSQRDFREFKRSFLYWARELYCPHKVYFYFDVIKDNVAAQITADEDAQTASVEYNQVLTADGYKTRPTPAETGKHEALHLFLHRMRWLAGCRCVMIPDLDEEEERQVRVLERVVK